jgi:hypothetical protein
MATSQRSWIPGFILIALGILFLIPRFADVRMSQLWPFIILAGGILFFVGFLLNRSEYGLLMPGTILTVTGLLFVYCTLEGWWSMRTLWPLFILAPGLGFVLMYLFGKREQGLLVPAGILIAVGSFFMIGKTSLDYLLAILLIVIGAVLLLTSRRG